MKLSEKCNTGHFHRLQKLALAPLKSVPPFTLVLRQLPSLESTLWSTVCTQVEPYSTCYSVSGLSVYTMILRFIWVARISSPFLFIAKQYCIVCLQHILFIHSPTDGHLGHFQCGALGIKLL